MYPLRIFFNAALKDDEVELHTAQLILLISNNHILSEANFAKYLHILFKNEYGQRSIFDYDMNSLRPPFIAYLQRHAKNILDNPINFIGLNEYCKKSQVIAIDIFSALLVGLTGQQRKAYQQQLITLADRFLADKFQYGTRIYHPKGMGRAASYEPSTPQDFLKFIHALSLIGLRDGQLASYLMGLRGGLIQTKPSEGLRELAFILIASLQNGGYKHSAAELAKMLSLNIADVSDDLRDDENQILLECLEADMVDSDQFQELQQCFDDYIDTDAINLADYHAINITHELPDFLKLDLFARGGQQALEAIDFLATTLTKQPIDFLKFIDNYQWQILNLNQIMGIDGIDFLQHLLNSSLMELERFLEAFTAHQTEQLNDIREVYEKHHLEIQENPSGWLEVLLKFSSLISTINSLKRYSQSNEWLNEGFKNPLDACGSLEAIQACLEEEYVRIVVATLEFDRSKIEDELLLTKIHPIELVRFLSTKYSSKPNQWQIYKEMLQADLSHAGLNSYLHDTEQDSDYGQTLAKHNQQVSTELSAHGMDINVVHSYEKKMYFSVDPTIHSQHCNELGQYRIEQWDKRNIQKLTLENYFFGYLFNTENLLLRRLDDGMCMHVVIDENTQKPIAMLWLYFIKNTISTKMKPSLVGKLEFSRGFNPQKTNRELITTMLLLFTSKHFIKDIGAEGLIIMNSKDEQSKSLVKYQEEAISLAKIADFLSLDSPLEMEKMYFEMALKENYFYRYDSNQVRVMDLPRYTITNKQMNEGNKTVVNSEKQAKDSSASLKNALVKAEGNNNKPTAKVSADEVVHNIWHLIIKLKQYSTEKIAHQSMHLQSLLSRYVNTVDDLIMISNQLPVEKCQLIYACLKKNFPNIISFSCDFQVLHNAVSSKHFDAFFEVDKEHFISVINKYYNVGMFVSLLKLLSSKQRREMYRVAGDSLGGIIHQFSDLKLLRKALPADQFDDFFPVCIPHLTRIYLSEDKVIKLFHMLSPEQCGSAAQVLKDKHACLNSLKKVSDALPHDKFKQYFAAYRSTLGNEIEGKYRFNQALQQFCNYNSDNETLVCAALIELLPMVVQRIDQPVVVDDLEASGKKGTLENYRFERVWSFLSEVFKKVSLAQFERACELVKDQFYFPHQYNSELLKLLENITPEKRAILFKFIANAIDSSKALDAFETYHCPRELKGELLCALDGYDLFSQAFHKVNQTTEGSAPISFSDFIQRQPWSNYSENDKSIQGTNQWKLLYLYRKMEKDVFDVCEQLLKFSVDMLQRFLNYTVPELFMLISDLYHKHNPELSNDDISQQWQTILNSLLIIYVSIKDDVQEKELSEVLNRLSSLKEVASYLIDRLSHVVAEIEDSEASGTYYFYCPDEKKDFLLMQLEGYTEFSRHFARVNDKAQEQHQVSYERFLMEYHWKLLCLYKIMGEDAFRFCKGYVAATVQPLIRVLNGIEINELKYLQDIQMFYATHATSIFKGNGRQQWENILHQLAVLGYLYQELSSSYDDCDVLYRTTLSELHSCKTLTDIDSQLRHILVTKTIPLLGLSGLSVDEDTIIEKIKQIDVAQLLRARNMMDGDEFQRVFEHMLKADFSGQGMDDFLHNTRQSSEIGVKIAHHNQQVATVLKENGIDREQALNYPKVMRFSDHAGIYVVDIKQIFTTLWKEICELHRQLQDDEIYQTLAEYTNKKNLLKSVKRNLHQVLTVICSKNKDKAISEFDLTQLRFLKENQTIRNLIHKIKNSIPVLKNFYSGNASNDPSVRVFIEHGEHFVDHAGHLDGVNDDELKKQTQANYFRIEQWDKNDIRTYKLGNYVGCCLAMNSFQFPAMIQRRMDDAMFMHVVIDEKTDTPVALNWLFFSKDKKDSSDGIYVTANFYEIHSRFGLYENKRDLIVNMLMKFTGEYYTPEIGANAFIMRALSYGLIPDFTQFDSRNAELEKLGGFLSLNDEEESTAEQRYFLDALMCPSFHVYEAEKQRILSLPAYTMETHHQTKDQPIIVETCPAQTPVVTQELVNPAQTHGTLFGNAIPGADATTLVPTEEKLQSKRNR